MAIKKLLKYFLRGALVLLTTVIFLFVTLWCAMWILVHGPSSETRRLFVTSVTETSAAKFLAHWYLSNDEVERITAPPVELVDIEVNEDLISIDNENAAILENDEDGDGIEVVDIKGTSYSGKLMIVADPKRVFVGIPTMGFGEGKSGLSVRKMIDEYGAVAGTNAGGFYDPNGSGTGGIPDGIVMYDGELMWGELNSYYSLAGIDGNGLLHVGKMTAQSAIDAGVMYAASYGPALIINGEVQNERRALGGGLNPRTAIGQRADGAMLLLVVNGRSVESLGATYDDLVEIFVRYGAVNATNLDGGSSSLMMMNGEYLTDSAYIYGERVVATSILVKEAAK